MADGAVRNFILLITLFVAVFLGLAVLVYRFEWESVRFPLFAGGVAIALCIAELVMMRRGGGDPAQPAAKPDSDAVHALDQPQAAAQEPQSVRQVLTVLAWIVAIVPAAFVLGYGAGIPLYILAYLKYIGRGWAFSLAIAVASFLVVYVGFLKLLGVPLPMLPIGMN